MKQKFIPGR